MKKLKVAMVTTAVLAALSSANVFAGANACIEVMPAGDGVNIDAGYWKTLFEVNDAGAGVCNVNYTGDNAALQGANGSVTVNTPVFARETTKDLTLTYGVSEFGLTSTIYAFGPDSYRSVFYIPTTAIPDGSRFEFVLSTNATAPAEEKPVTFQNQQLYLVALVEVLGPDNTVVRYDLRDVASTDGPVRGESRITFLVNNPTTIAAGTRMLISSERTNREFATLAEAQAFLDANPGFGRFQVNLQDTVACNDPWIKLAVENSLTVGGSKIIGGNTLDEGTAQIFASQQQFTGLYNEGSDSLVGGSTPPARGQVDAFDPSRLTEFVNPYFDTFENEDGTREVRYTKRFANDVGQDLTVWVNHRDVDALLLKPYASKVTTGAEFGVRDTALNGVGVLSLYDYNTGTTGAGGTSVLAFLNKADTAATRRYEMTDFFNARGTAKASTYFMRETGDQMAYVYDVNMNWGIDFASDLLKDRPMACQNPVTSHRIGVNGTELKVPYLSTDNDMQWVRISNENNAEAEVYFDIYGEEGTDQVMDSTNTNVFLGTIPANSSKVFFARRDILAAATAQGYVQTEEPGTTGPGQQAKQRHTVTFLVTAPSDAVHGVSVQKIPGGVDRVIPVLRNHDEVKDEDRAAIWQQ